MTADELARAFAGESLPDPMNSNPPSLDRYLGGIKVGDELLIAGGMAKQIDFATIGHTNVQIVYEGRKRRNDGGPSHHVIHADPQWVDHNTERTRALLKEQLHGRTFRFPTNDHEV